MLDDGSNRAERSKRFCRKCLQVRAVLTQCGENFHTLDTVDAQICFQVQIDANGVGRIARLLGDDLDQQRPERASL